MRMRLFEVRQRIGCHPWLLPSQLELRECSVLGVLGSIPEGQRILGPTLQWDLRDLMQDKRAIVLF